MGTSPPEGDPPRQGRLQRFMPGRRDERAADEGAGARTEGVDPSDDRATVVDSDADSAAREPRTRISAADTASREPTVVDTPAPARAAPTSAVAPEAAGDRRAAPAHDVDRMRVPGFAPLAIVAGWLAAWGLAALAAQCVQEAGVELGQGLGVAEAAGAPDGVADGIWLLVIVAGAWLFGGYVAARMARGNGTRHALLAWVLAMLATGADAITAQLRDGYTSVLTAIDLPAWVGTGLGDGARTVVVYAVFALTALVAALVGGGIGSGANAMARRRART